MNASVTKWGTVSILNCTDGDTKITFNPRKPADVARAKSVIEDMLKRGFAIMVEDEHGNTQRCTAFDPTTCEYIVGEIGQPATEDAVPSTAPKAPRRVPVSRSRAMAVGPTAGGGIGGHYFGVKREELRRPPIRAATGMARVKS